MAAGTASAASAAVKTATSHSANMSTVAVAAVTASSPPAGGYTATNPQTNGPITFSVSSSRTSLQHISIPTVYLTCAPPGDPNPAEPFGIAAAPLKPDGSFTATITKGAVYLGHKATFTYTFRGNFHGVAPTGAARAAGTFRETLTYSDSAARTCTSNTQSWTATHNA
jgi:hypothetical protein